MTTRSRVAIAAAAPLIVAVAALGARWPGIAEGTAVPALSIGGYVLVYAQRVDADFDDETYVASVVHHGAPADRDAVAVAAFVTSRSPEIRVIDGDLTFGGVRAGATAPSRDAFTVRKRRGTPLDTRQITWRIAGRPDRLVPEAWIGTWNVVARYFDLATNAAVGTDRFVDVIGPGGAVGFSLAGPRVRCTDVVRADLLAMHCELTASADGCVRSGRLDFEASASPDVIRGRGAWTHTAIGVCGWFPAQAGQRVEIEARRATRSLEEPYESSPTLVGAIAHNPPAFQDALR